jgi:hypothetical protein
MRRNLRLVSHEKPCGAFCDWCPTVRQSAQNAKPFRKFAKSNFGLEIGLFKKKYAAQFAIRLFKNKKSNSGLEIRLFRKKACGAFCD